MTLRTRVTWILLATLAPLGLVVGIGLYQFVRTSLLARLDEALAERAELLGSAVRLRDGKMELDVEDVAMPQYERESGSGPKQIAYFEVFQIDQEGKATLFERSPSLGTGSLLEDTLVPASPIAWNVKLSNGHNVRVIARRVRPSPEGDEQRGERGGEPGGKAVGRAVGRAGRASPDAAQALIAVAVSRETVENPLKVLAIGLISAGVILLVTGSLAARWAVTRGLEPVGRFADQVGAVDVARPGVRLQAVALPAEIAPIQARLNELLARVDEAMAREKRFSAAAAHELRTPVAELRTLLEVASSRARSAEEAARTIETAVASVERLDRLVGAMLRLLRIESGREPVNPAPVPILPSLRECIDSARAVAEQRRVAFAIEVPGELSGKLIVMADEGLVRLALRNLVANAAEYANEKSNVTVTAVREGTELLVRIANASPISSVDGERIGEPLWRSDAARANSEHLGLGLTLARAALHSTGAGFSIRFHEGRVVAEIRLPAC
ncbi:MAG: hypothetical protein KF805_11315 [Phycisphaeraceae bacterium]|nr:hypothetical protein [Phycisphaeraceae bacterium]